MPSTLISASANNAAAYLYCGGDSELGPGGQCSKVYIFSCESSVLKKAIHTEALPSREPYIQFIYHLFLITWPTYYSLFFSIII